MLHSIANRAVRARTATSRVDRGMSELLKSLAKNRDPAVFERLFVEFGPRIKAFMIRQGADHETAEELAQETMLIVWRKAEMFSESKGSVSTWIFTIARNLRIDRLRRHTPWQEFNEERDERESDEPAPDEAVAMSQRKMLIDAALAQLPDPQLEVVTLSYIEGLSHGEIAERLDLPLGTVKSRMRLAYSKVREALGEEI